MCRVIYNNSHKNNGWDKPKESRVKFRAQV